MPEAEQMIAHRRARVAGLAQLAHAGGAMALGQRRAVGAQQQRHVAVVRRRQCQRLEQQALARRIAQVILAAQHVGDAASAHHRARC